MSRRPVLPRNAQCCCLQRRNVITHMLPCHAQHDTARGPARNRFCKCRCDMFLQWLRRILKLAPLGGLHGWRAWKAYLSPIHRFPDSGMWCAVGLVFGYPGPFGELNVQYRRLPLPFGQGKSSRARHPWSRLARKGLPGARRVGKRSGLWMRSGRKKQASRRSGRRIRKLFLVWIRGSWKGRFGGLGIEQ
jgi:hypothetical protein